VLGELSSPVLCSSLCITHFDSCCASSPARGAEHHLRSLLTTCSQAGSRLHSVSPCLLIPRDCRGSYPCRSYGYALSSCYPGDQPVSDLKVQPAGGCCCKSGKQGRKMSIRAGFLWAHQVLANCSSKWIHHPGGFACLSVLLQTQGSSSPAEGKARARKVGRRVFSCRNQMGKVP